MRSAVPHIDWQKLYEAAMLEMNPDKLLTCIGAAEQAIALRESLVDIAEVERRKLTDARSMLKSLSRIASSQGKQTAYETAPPRKHERLG
jgi:DNA polymerase sigma